MKKIIALLLVMLLSVSLFACSKSIETIDLKKTKLTLKEEESFKIEYTITPEDVKDPTVNWQSSNPEIASVDENGNVKAIAEGKVDIIASAGEVTATCKVTVKPKKVTKTSYVNIEGLYVDETYKSEENENLKLLYVFYTVKSTGDSFYVDSKSMKLNIEGISSYNSGMSQKACDYAPNYHYSRYLKEVNYGDKIKVVETFNIPSAALKEDKAISFEKSQIPEMEKLLMSTDDIVYMKGAKKIAEKADPKGYKSEVEKHKDADAQTVAKVQKELNGYSWDFWVSYGDQTVAYNIEFFSPNKYVLTVKTLRTTTNGTYKVKKGYILLDNGMAVTEAPYSFDKSGKFDFDIASAYSVN